MSGIPMDFEAIERPANIRANAWNGREALIDDLTKASWALKARAAEPKNWLAPPPLVDARDWRHPDVGWGLVLPDNDQATKVAKAKCDDRPELQPLLAARPGAPILRWRPELELGYLRRYYSDGTAQDLSVQAPNPGIGVGRVPQYLLIIGSPQEVPWSVQYALNLSTFVGRLDLPDRGLKNYLQALIDDWSGQNTQPDQPVLWSVDLGTPDITWLMAHAIGAKLYERFQADKDFRHAAFLTQELSTIAQLSAALLDRKPSLIVTTSHGMTGPLDNSAKMTAQLGAPVDRQGSVLTEAALGSWAPCGAIWYANACCSAGSDSPSRYQGLFEGGAIGETLGAIAKNAGAATAPLPRALLGMARPLRAFIGHVEPTFDWTLRDPITKQVFTQAICAAIYDRLCQQDKRTPVGYALQSVFKEAGSFFGGWRTARDRVNQNIGGMRDWALYCQLAAMDRQSLVILGDPTVALPLLPS